MNIHEIAQVSLETNIRIQLTGPPNEQLLIVEPSAYTPFSCSLRIQGISIVRKIHSNNLRISITILTWIVQTTTNQTIKTVQSTRIENSTMSEEMSSIIVNNGNKIGTIKHVQDISKEFHNLETIILSLLNYSIENSFYQIRKVLYHFDFELTVIKSLAIFQETLQTLRDYAL